MQLNFVEKAEGPERLVCEAEVLFDEVGPLGGLKLVGFSLWRGADGELHVTLPSRASGSGPERRFFDYVRSIDGTPGEPRRLKAWIVEQFRTRKANDSGGSAGSRAGAQADTTH